MTTIYNNAPLLAPFTRLDGTAYIGVASSEMASIEAQGSIRNLYRRPGDAEPLVTGFTKGTEARQYHVTQFLESSHTWLLFLDGDMIFPVDALERLRCHGLPCVSGHYVRRTSQVVNPIWYEDDSEFRWPMMPFRGTPQSGRLYRLGATGFGIWLIHRSVIEAVLPLLKGERLVTQDDMDIWPYDLREVLAGREQIQILRGRQGEEVGADIRLSFFIRKAGFTIWGDPDVSCGHLINYPLGIADWTAYDADYREGWAAGTESMTEGLRAEHETKLAEVLA